jgi:hypothetical protein
LLFEHPTCDALADFFLAEVFPELFPVEQPVMVDEGVAKRLDALSQEQLQSLLDQELAAAMRRFDEEPLP